MAEVHVTGHKHLGAHSPHSGQKRLATLRFLCVTVNATVRWSMSDEYVDLGNQIKVRILSITGPVEIRTEDARTVRQSNGSLSKNRGMRKHFLDALVPRRIVLVIAHDNKLHLMGKVGQPSVKVPRMVLPAVQSEIASVYQHVAIWDGEGSVLVVRVTDAHETQPPTMTNVIDAVHLKCRLWSQFTHDEALPEPTGNGGKTRYTRQTQEEHPRHAENGQSAWTKK
mmetsp:Transcript_65198/g.172758  ORF Transcript_65198/g.172758 Transcript_65198/m.172758 type:complete len:225 (-) Transcript_65198:2-676(-)